MKKRILFLVAQMTLGGQERRAVSTMRALRRRFDIRLGSLSDQRFYRHFCFNPTTSEAKLSQLAARCCWLRSVLRRFRPHLIMTWDLQSGIYAKAALLTLGNIRTPLLAGYGASVIDDRRIRFTLKHQCLLPRAFVCNSHAGRVALDHLLGGRRPIHVIAGGVDYAKLRQTCLHPSSGPWRNNEGLVVGYVGKLDQHKRGDRMVDIAVLLGDESPPPTVVIVGGGEHLDAAKQKVAANPNLQCRTHLLGPVENASSVAAGFDIGVLCSDTEGLPGVLLEFMAMGVPCVSTDVGDVSRILDDGRAGVIVRGDPVKGTAEAVRQLLHSPKRRADYASRGLARVQSHFTVDHESDAYAQLFDEIIGK